MSTDATPLRPNPYMAKFKVVMHAYSIFLAIFPVSSR